MMEKPADKSKKNSLNRYVEIIPHEAYRSHKIKEKLYKTAAIATIIFFIAVSGIATVATGLLAPAYLPIAALAVLSLVDFVYKGYSFFAQNGAAEGQQADEEKFVVAELKNLSKKSEHEVLDVFHKAGIMAYEIPKHPQVTQSKLLSLILRHNYWVKQEKDINDEIAKLRLEKSEDPQITKSTRLLIFNLEQQAQIAKIWSAYFYGITKNPQQQAELKNICQIQLTSVEDRYLNILYNNSDPFIEFNDKSKAPIGASALNKMSVQELSKRLMEAAPA